MSQSTAAAIRLSVTVPARPERAFEAFTKEMGAWWPLASHSICEDEAAEVIFEEHVGGRVYERSPQGQEQQWAKILVWEPPHRLVLEWRPNPEPGPRTEVEVTFTFAENATRVDLEHRAWERLGDDAEEVRSDYASERGWAAVMSDFVRSFDETES